MYYKGVSDELHSWKECRYSKGLDDEWREERKSAPLQGIDA
jgi:hypothetical protein